MRPRNSIDSMVRPASRLAASAGFLGAATGMPPASSSGSSSAASRRRVIRHRRDPRRPTMRSGIISSFPGPGGSASRRERQLSLGAGPPAGGSAPGNDDLLGAGLERQLTALQIHVDTLDRLAVLVDEDLRHRVLDVALDGPAQRPRPGRGLDARLAPAATPWPRSETSTRSPRSARVLLTSSSRMSTIDRSSALAERVEDDHLVDAVDELGAEGAPQLGRGSPPRSAGSSPASLPSPKPMRPPRSTSLLPMFEVISTRVFVKSTWLP